MARPYSPRVQKIVALVAELPRSFAEIEAALPEAERAGLPQLVCRMTEAKILRALKRVRRAPDGKGRFVYARGNAAVADYRLRRHAAPRPLPVLTERGAPRVSMESYSALCKAFRGPSAPLDTPAASTVRTVRGIDTMRPNRDVAQHALPVGRFSHPVSEFEVVR